MSGKPGAFWAISAYGGTIMKRIAFTARASPQVTSGRYQAVAACFAASTLSDEGHTGHSAKKYVI
jgi:hypothetical protein